MRKGLTPEVVERALHSEVVRLVHEAVQRYQHMQEGELTAEAATFEFSCDLQALWRNSARKLNTQMVFERILN